MITFIRPGSPAYRPSNQLRSFVERSLALMMRIDVDRPAGQQVDALGNSPLDAHDPSTDLAADDFLQRHLDLRRQVADQRHRPPLAQAATAVSSSPSADDFEGHFRASAAGDCEDSFSGVALTGLNVRGRPVGSRAPAGRRRFDGQNPAAAGFEYLNDQQADHPRPDDNHDRRRQRREAHRVHGDRHRFDQRGALERQASGSSKMMRAGTATYSANAP